MNQKHVQIADLQPGVQERLSDAELERIAGGAVKTVSNEWSYVILPYIEQENLHKQMVRSFR